MHSLTLRTHEVSGSKTVVPICETYEVLMFTDFWPMFAGLLVLTVILLEASIAIHMHGIPPSSQLKVGTMPQLFASANWIAVGVV